MFTYLCLEVVSCTCRSRVAPHAFLINTFLRWANDVVTRRLMICCLFADSGEFPTLLHFAACHGLEKLCTALMDCLGFNDAIQTRNASEMTPAELAHVNGHFELANKLHALHVQIYKEWNQQHVYDYIQQNNYQIPPPPRPVHEKIQNNGNSDPFGTLKASKKITEKPDKVLDDMEEGDDDVFITNTVNEDKFGTLKANKVMNSMRNEQLQDYRASNNKPDLGQSTDDLTITDELLKLLEDFQKKSYSAKEMEMLFESWKRKASIEEPITNNNDNVKESKVSKKQRATNLILKLFKQHGVVQHSMSDPAIKPTKSTKTYRKPSLSTTSTEVKINPPNPAPGNETIIEGTFQKYNLSKKIA